jgi:hypothetical protein
MARVASRKNCMKKVSRRLHKKATTKRQRKQVIGKASKACSRKMRVRRAGKKGVRKTSRRQALRQAPALVQPQGSLAPQIGYPIFGNLSSAGSIQPSPVASIDLANPPPAPLQLSPAQASRSPARIDDYSYVGYLQRFEQAAARVAGGQVKCTPSALERALRSESRNLLVGLNNEDRAAYEIDPRRQNMIRAYNEVLGRCDADPFNNMAQARQAVQNV